MKGKLTVPLMLSLALASGGALATEGQSAQLKVIGKITTPACQVSFDGGDTVDYGDIARTLLETNDYKKLQGRPGDTLRVTCDGTTQVAMKVTDDRTDSKLLGVNVNIDDYDGKGGASGNLSSDLYGYGLGAVSVRGRADPVPVGAWALSFLNLTIDGNPAFMGASGNGGTSWTGHSHRYVAPNEHIGWVKSGSNVLGQGKIFTADVRTGVTLNKSTVLQDGNDIPLDGSATLTIVYL